MPVYTKEDHEQKRLFSDSKVVESFATMELSKESATTVLQSFESKESGSKEDSYLIVEYDALHVGKTGNHLFYTEEAIESSLASWVVPFRKPILLHHQQHSGEPVGRIISAEKAYSEKTNKTVLRIKAAIIDEKAKEKVLNGLYNTVSVGVSLESATCSICGTDRTKKWCNHWKGEEYEGVPCHFSVGGMKGMELSYVNVPGDSNAGTHSIRKEYGSVRNMFGVSEESFIDVKSPETNLFGLVEESYISNVKESLESVFANEAIIKKGSEEMNLEEAMEKIDALEKERDSALLESGRLSTKVSEREEKLNELEKSVESLQEANKNLMIQVSESVLDKVADMKMKLKKPDTLGKTKEQVMEAHVSRTQESLMDLYGDLELEVKALEAQQGAGFEQEEGVLDTQQESDNELGDNEFEKPMKKAITVTEAQSTLSSFFKKK